MKLLELRLHGFGRWVNTTFQPAPGLNVILGPNEVGKSTLQRFMQGMLYGLQQPGALRRTPLPELAQLEPWASGDYRGEICYALQNGDEFWVARDFRDPSKTSVYNAATGDPLRAPQDRRKELLFAQEHLGMSEAEFLGSACMGALSADPTSAPGLAARVAAVLQSGSEQQGPERALAALDRQRAQVRASMQPMQQRLQDLQAKAARQQAAAADLEMQRIQRRHAQAAAQALTDTLASLPPDLVPSLHRLLARHDALLADLAAARAAAKNAATRATALPDHDPWPVDADLQAETLWQHILAASADLQAARTKASEAEAQVARLRSTLQALPAEPALLRAQWEGLMVGEPTGLSPAVIGSAAGLLAVAGVAGALALRQPLFYAVAGLALVGGVLWLMAAQNKKSHHERRIDAFLKRLSVMGAAAVPFRLDEASQAQAALEDAQDQQARADRALQLAQQDANRLQERLRALLALAGIVPGANAGISAGSPAWGTASAADVAAFAQAVAQRRQEREGLQASQRAAEQAQQRAAALQTEAGEVADQIQHLCTAAETALGEELLDPDSLLARIDGLQERLATQQQELARLDGAIHALEATLGDPALTELDLQALREELAAQQARLSALALAKELLQEAAAELGRQMAPRLVRAVSEWSARLTDGRYTQLTVAADLGVRVHSTAAGRLVGLESLSTGARDQLYLALRLGLVDALTAEYGEAPPLLLDDPFAHADDARAAAGFVALAQAAATYQLFVFTCRARDQAAAEAAAARYGVPFKAWNL